MADDIKKKVCGIVMPIAAMDDCPESHWIEVKQIIVSVVEEMDYECKLVSEETDVGVIQKRIVQNLYENELIICDVSCRNANVMFELGMRLAFDKPVILIKDDKTPYSFDTSPVEHLTYRRDLRFNSVNEFKLKLSAKIKAVMDSENSSSFLSSFGTFKTAELKQENVEPYELLLEEIYSIRKLISNRTVSGHNFTFSSDSIRGRADLKIHSMELSRSGRGIMIKCSGPKDSIKYFVSSLKALAGVVSASIREPDDAVIVSILVGTQGGEHGTELFNNLVEIIKPETVRRPKVVNSEE